MKRLWNKLAYGIFILISVATVVFWLFSSSFPNPEDILVSDRTDSKTIEAIKKELQLDQPKWRQYVLFMNDLSPISIYATRAGLPKGVSLYRSESRTLLLKFPYLRHSFKTGRKTTSLLADAYVGTLVLAIAAMCFAATFGIIFGVIMALKRGSWIDQGLLTISTLGISVPSFFSAILLSWLFGYVLAETTGFNVVGSLFELDAEGKRYPEWKNLILPAFALGVRPLSVITQLTRNAMLDTLGKDYIRTAKAKGLGSYRIVFRHALKTALNPVITSISGWFASLLAGAFFVEYIFSWKGVGSLSIQALENSDLPVIMGSVLSVAAIFIALNMIVDWVYTLLDPRTAE
ncbi:MAG: ABC transporter permease [Flavobacteriales bacterium]|nr:ABC transporter permease [Flavobacteriales bacterium]